MIECKPRLFHASTPEGWGETASDYGKRGIEKAKNYPRPSKQQDRRFKRRQLDDIAEMRGIALPGSLP